MRSEEAAGEGLRLRGKELASEQEAEFALLVARQARLMYRVAFAVLRNMHDAEDAVQETLLKLYRSGAWKRLENERAFLARSVWRMAIDRLPKKEERRIKDGEEFTAHTSSPEADAMQSAQATRLRRLMDGLPEELRQPLVLSALEELSSREVAEMMGIPERTVRTRVMRAKEELRKRFVASEEALR